MVAFGFRDSVLPDFVEQRFVADLQQRGRLLAVPVGLFESLCDGLGFGFILSVAGQAISIPCRISGLCSGIAVRAAAAVIFRLKLRHGQVFIAQN